MRRLLAASLIALACTGIARANEGDPCGKVENPDASIPACTKIITAGHVSRANLAIAYANRGAAYSNQGDYDRTIADETRAIALDPRNALAYLNRGFAYDGKGDYDHEIEDETKAISLNPRLPLRGQPWRGYGGKGDYDRGCRRDEAIELDPASNGYATRGTPTSQATTTVRSPTGTAIPYGSIRGSHWPMSIAASLTAAKATSTGRCRRNGDVEINNHRAAYLNAVPLGGKGDFDREIEDETKAIALNGQLPLAYHDRAVAHAGKRNHDQAIADETSAIRLNPQYAAAYYGRGSALVSKGEVEKALSDFRLAAQLLPAGDTRDQMKARIVELERHLADATPAAPPAATAVASASAASVGRRVALVIGNAAIRRRRPPTQRDSTRSPRSSGMTGSRSARSNLTRTSPRCAGQFSDVAVKMTGQSSIRRPWASARRRQLHRPGRCQTRGGSRRSR
jgi:tetratricopeptide (TPR) repeat protein